MLVIIARVAYYTLPSVHAVSELVPNKPEQSVRLDFFLTETSRIGASWIG